MNQIELEMPGCPLLPERPNAVILLKVPASAFVSISSPTHNDSKVIGLLLTATFSLHPILCQLFNQGVRK